MRGSRPRRGPFFIESKTLGSIMSSKIASILALTPAEDEATEKSLSVLRSLSEWFSETVEAIKDTPLLKVLGSTGEAAKEWSGTVKAAGKLIEKLTKETSPQTLGWLACTISYQRAAEEAVRKYGKPASRIPFSGEVVSERLKGLRLDDPSIMDGFSLASAASHPFLRAADEAFLSLLLAAGYDDAEQRNLLRNVRGQFKKVLQDILSGEQKEKFANFTQWLQLDTDDQRLDALLLSHAELQRAELEDQPALGIEPFSISDVYIESECGILPWRTIRDGVLKLQVREPVDPFSEDSGDRRDLAESVTKLLYDKKFNDAIVIQGAPGAGKSTFTKKLCVHLRKEGLIPIRIQLQYLRVDANIFDALQDVVTSFSGANVGNFRRDILPEKVFAEKVTIGGAEISPYVFIFDGWDEISLSAAEGFQQRVERLLDTIRQTFLNQNRNKVRVILTGRPSSAIGHSNFLRDETPVLTIRPIRPEQLSNYVSSLGAALTEPAFKGEEIDTWALGALDRYKPVLDLYGEEFPKVGDLEVLGQPLLAHLAMKVMARFKGDISQLITPPTTLYRHLVDLTCKRGGKYPTQTDDTGKGGRIAGRDLRALLHGTALAITAHGSESISQDELELRLETLGVGKDVFQQTRDHPLSNLMISFYFKGIHDNSGCEFLHKSFREYLAAEAIVEILKEYSQLAKEDLPEKPEDLYWQDFQEHDPRYWLTRKLGEVLSPQWLSREMTTHLSNLLAWEVPRVKTESDPITIGGAKGISTDPITVDEWCRVRDGLADLWDWWGEGVHLRPQPYERQKIWFVDVPPYAAELVKLSMRRSNYNRRDPPHPPRTVTVDANLGYGLFQLNCFVHTFTGEIGGEWLRLESNGAAALRWEHTSNPRRYQRAVTLRNASFVQFAPSGPSPFYFRNYAGRINCAGFAPLVVSEDPGYRWDFPSRTMMRGIDLAESDLRGLSFSHSDLSYGNLQGANLSEAQLAGTMLIQSNLREADLFAAHLFRAVCEGADVTGAKMYMTDLRYTHLSGLSGLSQEQIDSSFASETANLPEGLRQPAFWRALRQVVERSKRNSPTDRAEGPLEDETSARVKSRKKTK